MTTQYAPTKKNVHFHDAVNIIEFRRHSNSDSDSSTSSSPVASSSLQLDEESVLTAQRNQLHAILESPTRSTRSSPPTHNRLSRQPSTGGLSRNTNISYSAHRPSPSSNIPSMIRQYPPPPRPPQLHPFLQKDKGLLYDLWDDEFPQLGQAADEPATTPPTRRLHLHYGYHPFVCEVYASPPCEYITVVDVLIQVHEHMNTPISQDQLRFYVDSEGDVEDHFKRLQQRIAYQRGTVSAYRRIDFVPSNHYFAGMWFDDTEQRWRFKFK
ncbi:hypothetical protein BDN72DRAFT_521306 [Pluteus cervinus]|uniref:Uncharacterized protein n=1 Tax=Pluteus cervinus TaxID=181527 RepID=A0ACD3AXK2_9AGAR|nr:hypothetical protein BDN72DRAFT_521306 [Pluteus cervinus]